jgi:hypothetical protein
LSCGEIKALLLISELLLKKGLPLSGGASGNLSETLSAAGLSSVFSVCLLSFY